LPRPLRVELTGGVYHVVARGNERKAIFRDREDRSAYLARLAECSMRFQFRVLAYCLMSNHVHIALERGPIALSRIMLALQSFYVQRFNRRHRRVGHLFQGRYKSLLVQDERYLLALVRYIHMNPVAAGVVSRPDAFGWSSDLHYRAGVGPAWLDVGRLLDSFSRRRREAVAVYRRLMAERDSQTYEDVPDFLRAIKGEQKFANWALHAAGDSRRVSSGSTPEQIAHAIAAAENLSVERLRAPGKGFRESRARLIAAYLGKRDYGQSTAAMARCLAREESTFNRGVRRLEETMAKDPAVRARVEELAASLRHRNTGIHD
jgi:putative transposase